MDGKTGPRTVALSAPASALLDDRRRGQGRGYVFPTLLRPDGRPRTSIATCWAAVCETARLPADLRLHDLRHTYASQASVADEPRFLVSRLLGHRALSSTSRYTHLHDDEALAAAERVSSAVASLMARG